MLAHLNESECAKYIFYSLCFLHLPGNPVLVVRYVGVNAVLVGKATPFTPAAHANQSPLSLSVLAHQRTSTITMTTIPATSFESSADHVLRHQATVSRCRVALLAGNNGELCRKQGSTGKMQASS